MMFCIIGLSLYYSRISNSVGPESFAAGNIGSLSSHESFLRYVGSASSGVGRLFSDSNGSPGVDRLVFSGHPQTVGGFSQARSSEPQQSSKKNKKCIGNSDIKEKRFPPVVLLPVVIGLCLWGRHLSLPDTVTLIVGGSCTVESF